MSKFPITVPYRLSKDAYPELRIGLDGTRINEETILPQSITVEVEPNIWADIEDLVAAYHAEGHQL